ncbi:peroxisome assembly protein 12 [Bradysia coprophila]|uniref:peroxisome assembly protein 12 n=1 Tax=Bradysia coprophila TaxID=38358 RepID=UPI00187DBE9C|nr:peroxisome assembly protein 12 [Bradysia coprophila]
MAERGAHLTTTLQPKPSIFEVVASDSLHQTFNPAILRLCNYLATVNPAKYGWLVRYYDELFLLLNSAVQQYYIRIQGGSLSEVFYGLCRTKWSASTEEALTNRSKVTIFVCLVILPYLRTKIEKTVRHWQQELDDYPEYVKYRTIKRNVSKIWSGSVAVYECLQIFQYISYMANSSKSHSLLLRAVRMNLTYLPTIQENDWSWSDLFKGNFKHSAVLTSFIFRGLELSAFFLQFIQWWQNEASQGNLTNLPVPDPPSLDVNGTKYNGKCPICLQAWHIPTAVSVSGYVFCYKCIATHLGNSQTCPVTNYPTSIDDLIRIFDDSE